MFDSTFHPIVTRSNLSPRNGSVAVRQMNPIYKKGQKNEKKKKFDSVRGLETKLKIKMYFKYQYINFHV